VSERQREQVILFLGSRGFAKWFMSHLAACLRDLGEEQKEEIAWGLKRRDLNSLWVVQKLEEPKIPGNFVKGSSENDKNIQDQH
jgi:hypothetical protein